MISQTAFFSLESPSNNNSRKPLCVRRLYRGLKKLKKLKKSYMDGYVNEG